MRGVIVKELLRRWRSPASTIGLLAFPFLMAGMIGLVSSGQGSQAFPVIDLLLLNRDDGLVSDLLLGTLTDGPIQEFVNVTEVGEEGFQRMEDGDASALIVFPAGMSDALLEQRPVEIQLVRNPSEGIKPEVVQQGLEVLATYLDEGGKLLGEELADVLRMLEGDSFPGTNQLLTVSGALIERLGSYQEFLFPPAVWLESAKADDGDGPGVNVFGYVLVMVSVMSVLFAASRSVLDLYDEEKTGMLRRQLGAPVRVSWLVNGKIVFAVLFSEVLILLLLALGALLGWLSLPVNLPGLLLLTTAFAIASCGLLAIVYALCRTDKAAAGANWVVIMAMSALGGSMTTVDMFPPAVRQLSQFTLNYWAIQGMNDLLIFKEGFTSVLPNVGILLAVGAVTLPVAQLLMVRKFRRELP